MSEQDNLQNADGEKDTKVIKDQEVQLQTESDTTSVDKEAEQAPEADEQTTSEKSETSLEAEPLEEIKTEDKTKEVGVSNIDDTNTSNDNAEDHVEEIEAANAEDAEDESNAERHKLEDKDYHAMSMEQLVDEFEGLIKYQKIQTIKSHVDEIKSEFHSKYNALLDEKKEEFVNDGGNPIDFYYTNDSQKRFNKTYRDYRATLNTYYKDRENALKSNLQNRLEIIEEIKGLLNVEENINTTYKHFKELQDKWREAGPIPRDKYNNAWNTYHHHVERFYDFLHLNRDLRDMDFKHNLEKKLKIIDRAEELAADDNINRSFRELQVLHKLWKEELGPVAKEHREEIWERFSTATKTIHDKRQIYYADLDKAYEGNLVKKEEIIEAIKTIAEDKGNSHQNWQNKIKKVEALRQDFFNAGKVPIKVNEATWSKFKDAVRSFNRNKNAFYKGLKKEQYDNLQKKLELIKIAEDNKDNEDFDTATPLMKKIQGDWKKIGHVPRKDSDKIWKRFKSACNHYFDKLHAERKAVDKEFYDNLEKKEALLGELKAFDLTEKPESDIASLKEHITNWKAIGKVPYNKRFIDGKFYKTIDGLFDKLKMDKAKVEMIKFENKLESLNNPDDTRKLDNERNFIRKKIDEISSEINQLENNLQFFSNVDDKNPLVKDVHKNINKHKASLDIWKDKLRKIKELY
ncbi:DUF349 domain-containing protein [Ichthyenterobacterium sp. W332]|uniref:DUF349 domain-containing protein n=1 Tax=Microcosmobacter mediterraneus TaxID=3075607 RepID=A0ABU2YMY5_9FLAO|nr:DUF349 domain-containing protein [Ichthyenterobacterium sp. W332]MDT0559501.1 DUF349 domain-containing protein [Ichthyenterobacterium sp. W332]